MVANNLHVGLLIEPRLEKTCLGALRQGTTQPACLATETS